MCPRQPGPRSMLNHSAARNERESSATESYCRVVHFCEYYLVHATLRRLEHPALEALLNLHGPKESCHLVCTWDSLCNSRLSRTCQTDAPTKLLKPSVQNMG